MRRRRRTCGQIVCVLAHASSAYAHVPILWASVLALFAPWPLIYFTQWSVQRIFLAQLIVFLVAALGFSWAPLRNVALQSLFRMVDRAGARAGAAAGFWAGLAPGAGTRGSCCGQPHRCSSCALPPPTPTLRPC